MDRRRLGFVASPALEFPDSMAVKPDRGMLDFEVRIG